MENEKLRFQEAEKLITYILIGCAALRVIQMLFGRRRSFVIYR